MKKVAQKFVDRNGDVVNLHPKLSVLFCVLILRNYLRAREKCCKFATRND